MTIEIITEATDLAALHTHAANRGQVLQVRLRQLCREVATTTGQPTATRQPAEESPAVLTALGLPATPAPDPKPESVEVFHAGIRLH